MGHGSIIVAVGSVGIQGVKIQVEPVRKVHDKLEREALDSDMALGSGYVERKGMRHTWSIWNSCIGGSSLGFRGESSSDGVTEGNGWVAEGLLV